MWRNRSEGLSIVLVGATALFDREDLVRLADAFESCLTQLCREPDSELSKLEWLSRIGSSAYRRMEFIGRRLCA